MSAPTIAQHTGYLLANPHLFDEKEYEFALTPYNYFELTELGEDIQGIKQWALSRKCKVIIANLKKNEELCSTAKTIGLASAGSGAIFAAQSFSVESKWPKKSA